MRAAPGSEQERLARIYSRSAEIRRRRLAMRTGAGFLVLALFVSLGVSQLIGGTGPGAPRQPQPGPIARAPTSRPSGQQPPTPPVSRPNTPPAPGENPAPNDDPGQPSFEPGPIDQQILSLSVSFSVVNTNRSKVPCATDGLPYKIHGLLVAPANAITTLRSVTLYIHATSTGLWQWNFKRLPGYDYATEMALRGHASVIIDRLGFDGSGHPYGFDTCIGGEADIIHQVGQALRGGSYALDGRAGVPIQRVALAGHSLGTVLVESALGSFGGFDALMIISWGDIFTPTAARTIGLEVAPLIVRTCAAGGEPAEPGSPSGYTPVWEDPDSTFRAIAYNMDPAMLQAAKPLINLEPCGTAGSIGSAVAINNALISAITAPVLLIQGTNDPLVRPEGAQLHKERYISSVDVTLTFLDQAGHIPMLERRAPEFRRIASAWLKAKGF